MKRNSHLKRLLPQLVVILSLASCMGGSVTTSDKQSDDPWADRLATRKENFGVALRTASLRLVGELPTVAQIEELAAASNPRTTYEGMVSSMLADSRFRTQMLEFWRNTFKMGGSAVLDTAPALATQLTLQGGSYLGLLTATSGNCPTVAADGTLTAANCQNGVNLHAGVLTNPGVMSEFYSNMGFRRVRWVQETFACTAFPAEVGAAQDVGAAATYNAPWEFTSIAGSQNGGRIDFHDTAGVVCANCHATMNHIAPLFANFDVNGQMQAGIAVLLPTTGTPTAQLSDYLPPGEQTAWRLGVAAGDLASLGNAMAGDPAISECAVARAWNFALGRGDIVDTLTLVPSEVIDSQVASFTSDGYRFDNLLFRVFTSDDFIKY